MKACTLGPKAIGALGIVTAVLVAAMYFAAVRNDPSWAFGENTLSDLGVSDVQASVDLFTYGSIIGGILLCVFGLGKAYAEEGANRLSGCLLAIAAVFLVVVGLVNKEFGDGNTHFVAAVLLFLFIAASATASAIGDDREDRRLTSAVTTILLVTCVGYFFGSTLAAAEVVTVMALFVWIVAMGVKMLLSRGRCASGGAKG